MLPGNQSPPAATPSQDSVTRTSHKSAHKRKREHASVAAREHKKGRKADEEAVQGDGGSGRIVEADAEAGGLQAPDGRRRARKLRAANAEDARHHEASHSRTQTAREAGSDSGSGDQATQHTVTSASGERELQQPAGSEGTSADRKHASILSKFSKAVAHAQRIRRDHGTIPDEHHEGPKQAETETHGLTPLPQAAPAPTVDERPTYSTLPKWLAEPLTVSHTERRDFAECGISGKMLAALHQAGYEHAFATQSAVFQLLKPGRHQHHGDICISAATGSGKTLAYVLPMVSSIEVSSLSRLRGLIIVPTRELVRQARDTCETLAAGKGLKIGTAVGAVSLKEEQAHLMRDDQIFDPAAYREQKEGFMDVAAWKDFSLPQYIAGLPKLDDELPFCVTQPTPNIDILVCTPGRLVDHVRSTKGFSLEHLQWLVVDEADRLLNESFQEWVDTLIPALNLTPYYREGPVARELAALGHPMRKPHPLRKIILSATMTRDVEKLTSLRLQNPRHVVVTMPTTLPAGTRPATEDNECVEQYTLPPTLMERYVPAGNGADKPVQLLALLLSHVKVLKSSAIVAKGVANVQHRSREETSSSSDSDSSESSDDTDDQDDSSQDSSDDSLDDSSETSSDSFDSLSSDGDDDELDDELDKAPACDTYQQAASASHARSATLLPPTSASSTALVFTKSSEAAMRLSRLLAILHPPLAPYLATLTKSNSTRAMRGVIAAYRKGKTRVIIATDRASRGLDLPALGHVICYDVPTSVTAYVHRIGRTARAGRNGYAWTLVARREGRWFSNEVGGGQVKGTEKDAGPSQQKRGGVIRRSAGQKMRKTVIKISEHGDTLGSDIKARYRLALAELGSEVTEQQQATRS
ncbi:ATP-dependent RNA helicase dbp6 [Ascosphaera acerosa]|nr:ATP-dependent RNA helicase dbp6 [Ascosphaera acerosa]